MYFFTYEMCKYRNEKFEDPSTCVSTEYRHREERHINSVLLGVCKMERVQVARLPCSRLGISWLGWARPLLLRENSTHYALAQDPEA